MINLPGITKKKWIRLRGNLLWLFLFFLFMTGCSRHSTSLPPDNNNNSSDTTSHIKKLFDSTPVIVWIEAAANFSRLGTAEKMDTVFAKLAHMGAKGIVIDVKGISGLVNYTSSIATTLKTWNGYTQAADFDYLKQAITKARKNGLKVFVSMSVFGEGINYYGARMGKVFTDTSFAAIQSQVITASGEVKKITDVYAYGLLNPLQPKAQEYELSLIDEVASKYDIDGFVLDYTRYYDICADFSDYSLNKFKAWASLSSVATTDIVQSWKLSNGAVMPNVTGPLYNKWLEFRAQTIYDFVAKAHNTIKKVNPNMAFCSYAGAWYDSYYYVGVNWASKTFDPSVNGYAWATTTYKNTGYAELLDMFMTGNYTATLTGAGWWTVQGQISGTKSVLNNANIHYGAIDIGNTVWQDMQNMKDAIKMIRAQTGGIMLFDLVHIDDPAYNQFHKTLYDDISAVLQ